MPKIACYAKSFFYDSLTPPPIPSPRNTCRKIFVTEIDVHSQDSGGSRQEGRTERRPLVESSLASPTSEPGRPVCFQSHLFTHGVDVGRCRDLALVSSPTNRKGRVATETPLRRRLDLLLCSPLLGVTYIDNGSSSSPSSTFRTL